MPSPCDIFNFCAGCASIIGLGFSFWIYRQTGSIRKELEYNHCAESFNLHHDDIMEDLWSSGLNAIREEFPDSSLLTDFQRKLISYRKEYYVLFSEDERSSLNRLIAFTESPSINNPDGKSLYRRLLIEVTTKPRIRRK